MGDYEADSSDEEEQSFAGNRNELFLAPTECYLPRTKSNWKVKRRGQVVNVSILPPVGIPFKEFRFKVLADSMTIQVIFKFPSGVCDGEEICDFWMNAESNPMSECHPKISGYDSFFAPLRDPNNGAVYGTMYVPLKIYVEAA